jgi:hypothetical protein
MTFIDVPTLVRPILEPTIIDEATAALFRQAAISTGSQLVPIAEASVEWAGGAAAAGAAAGLAEVGLIAVAGYVIPKVEYLALKDTVVDHYFHTLGGRAWDLFHAGTPSGGNSPPSWQEARLMMMTSMFLANRAMKDTMLANMSVVNARQMITEARLKFTNRAVRQLFAEARRDRGWSAAQLARLDHIMSGRILVAQNALHATMRRELVVAEQAQQQWVSTYVARPLGARVVKTEANVVALTGTVVATATVARTALATATKAETEIQSLTKRVTAMEKWVDDCGEPVCETVGPKTDWGKLLKRFAPKLIWLLLAEIAATHPEELEKATVELVNTLAPVLEGWAKSYLGFGGGSQSGAVKTVENKIGTSDLTNLL